ncbi:MAG: hypothetical protein HWN66_03470 [Candidatus Helarchaeota archaeon]|nr:hypothetical protein [Candidatus Helarchaeota archaeon]
MPEIYDIKRDPQYSDERSETYRKNFYKSFYSRRDFLKNKVSGFDEKTEVLTEKGFLFFKDLNRSCRVASLVNGFLKFVKPLFLGKKKWDGLIYLIQSRSVDLVITPNLKLFYKEARHSSYSLKPISTITFQNLNLKSNCNWIGNNIDWFLIPSIKKGLNKHKIITMPQIRIKMDYWLEFLGYFLSEGSTTGYKRSGYIRIRQKRGNKRDKIRILLDKMPFRYREYESGFRINDKQLFQFLKKYGKAHEKYVPTDIKMLNIRQLKILFNSLVLGDGHISPRGYISYYTSSQKLKDDLCEIILKIGFSPTVYTRIRQIKTDMKFARKNENAIILKSYRPSYTINVRKSKNLKIISNKHIKKSNYSGVIYNLKVPSNIIYIRRNGKCCWCGNN